jgi:hypothetical protein
VTPEENAVYGLDATGKSKSSGAHNRRVTVEQAQRVVDLRAAGWKQTDIAREVGLSPYPIWAILGGWHWTVREGHVRLPEQGGAQ